MTQQHEATVTIAHTGASAPVTEFEEEYEDMNDSFNGDEEHSGWEDDEGDFSKPRTGNPSGTSNFWTARRRRPAIVTKVSIKQVPTKSAATVQSSQITQELPLIAREDLVNGLLHGSLFTGRYALDVAKRALLLLRHPLSFLFFLYLLGLLTNQLDRTLKSIFSPICIIPGLSRIRRCQRAPLSLPDRDHRPARWADYPRLVEVENSAFEQVMNGAIGGSALSFEVKQAEMATTDLVVLVRISNLKAKETLAASLVEFIESAKKTGRGLHKLSAKVGGVIDSIMATNEYALKAIETARANEPAPWSLPAIVPWAFRRKPTNVVVTETFEEAMNTLSRHLQRLIIEAEISDKNLNNLEERLKTIHDLLLLEGASISEEKSDCLAELWTILGGNRNKLRNFDDNLALLKDLATYRKQASGHVVVALEALRSMAGVMEDMRERAAAPDLEGSAIPIEKHIKTIENGLESLKERRVMGRRIEEEAMQRVIKRMT